jgi:hypothetical protein
MGNLFSNQLNSNRQLAVNEVYTQFENTCVASCSQLQSGNTVFLDGTVSGDITFQQECNANAKCQIDNNINNTLSILQGLKQDNATSAGLFPNFVSINLNLSEQEIRNQVVNQINNICQADVNQVTTNNMVYAVNSETGDISFLQKGNATADCMMTNIATANLNLKQTAEQSNTISAGVLGGIIAIIIIVIIIVIVGRAVSKGSKESEKK